MPTPAQVAIGLQQEQWPRQTAREQPVDRASKIPDAEARSRALSASLQREANANPGISTAEPKLEHWADGTYHYQGHIFSAVIKRDGTVHFSDEARGSVDLKHATAHFGLNDALMRAHGEDPYGAEKAWFMQHTKDLRMRLAKAARTRDLQAALAALPIRLMRIWQRDEPAKTRRLQIFRIWNDCADDEAGKAARARIEAFIRSELPRGSPQAYTDSELRRMNAHRPKSSLFSPYDRKPPGGP